MFSFKPKPLSAPTPPGTPQNELEEEYINSEEYKISQESTKIDVTDNSKESSKNFFDQIVNKLSLFSFKSVPASISSNPSSYDLSKPDQNNHNPSFIFKPQPIYVKSTTPVTSSAEISKTKNEIILTNLIREDESRNYFKFINQENFIHDANKEEDDIESELVFTELNKKCETPPPSPSKFSPPLPQEEAYDEEDFKKSAFVKVASLNPLINKTIDLNSLLGSLSSLKRNQRACKYY